MPCAADALFAAMATSGATPPATLIRPAISRASGLLPIVMLLFGSDIESLWEFATSCQMTMGMPAGPSGRLSGLPVQLSADKRSVCAVGSSNRSNSTTCKQFSTWHADCTRTRAGTTHPSRRHTMKYENLMLSGLFVVCLLVCTLGLGAMLSATPSSVQLASAG